MNVNFILEKALSLYPENEAVVCGEHRFTYRQFGARLYRLANFLNSTGVRRGDRVAGLTDPRGMEPTDPPEAGGKSRGQDRRMDSARDQRFGDRTTARATIGRL